MWKDMLLALFNLIDYNHSGFISRNEFADVIKLILYGENGTGDVNDAYVEELTSAMDFDKNGKIDFNEFLGTNKKKTMRNFVINALYFFLFIVESFRIVNVNKSANVKRKSSTSLSLNGKTTEHKVRV